jgi:hypothetical protein
MNGLPVGATSVGSKVQKGGEPSWQLIGVS